MRRTLSRVEGPVPEMAQVDVPQEGVGLAHPAEDRDRRQPQRDSGQHTPPGNQSENEHRRE